MNERDRVYAISACECMFVCVNRYPSTICPGISEWQLKQHGHRQTQTVSHQ
ncbi:hypothetical protein EXN66_Car004843 [Channa argus]|uniref:Uncharacterized protein n=1 Tax=Channa argus TaxID=215402 RepID=A0A6G1PFS2_CHAAH|nr:hypothetical protein EXN66_Car004843 [Channa argus]